MRKLIFILLFIFGTFFVPKISFSQNIEDSIAKAESSVSIDSTSEVSSITSEENTKQKIDLYFEDARLDTSLIAMRQPLNDTIDRLKQMKVYQYHPINNAPLKEKKSNSAYNTSFFSDGFWKFIFWFLTIGLLVVIIVLYAIDGNVGIFSRKSKNVQEVTKEEDVFSQNIFDLDYTRLIQQATEIADFNKAVRLHFLKILTLLSNKKLISYSVEKTNFDYQFQLIHTKHYQNFLLTANYYEYAWYSGIVISNIQYHKIINSFLQFEQQLN